MNDLAGRVALVTGGGRDVGAGDERRLLGAGDPRRRAAAGAGHDGGQETNAQNSRCNLHARSLSRSREIETTIRG